jgi:hypothetical protein
VHVACSSTERSTAADRQDADSWRDSEKDDSQQHAAGKTLAVMPADADRRGLRRGEDDR